MNTTLGRFVHAAAVLLVAFLVSTAATAGAEAKLPAPPQVDYPLLDSFGYATDQAARTAWQPMNHDSPPVLAGDAGGRKVLKLPCHFKDTKIQRGSWDKPVKLDLTECAGLRFSFYCPDAAPVAGFRFYLHSGSGWYATSFEATEEDGWTTVTIDKSAMTPEDKPGGWSTIDRIRISAWRGGDTDTALYLADLGVLGAGTQIAVIRGDFAALQNPDEKNSVVTYTQLVAGHLGNIGASYCVISDLDVTPALLKSKKLVILPHNPVLPERTLKCLADYLRDGGKLISFYGVPGELQPLLGIRTGRHVAKTFPGQFAVMRKSRDALAGQPEIVGQWSWNILQGIPVPGKSHVAAQWQDDQGRDTGEPAIIVSDNGILMTHVLTETDPAGKDRLLLAMVGHFLPGVWKESATRQIRQIGMFAGYADAAGALAALSTQARGKPDVMQLLKAAETARDQAGTLAAAEKFSEAIEQAQAARKNLVAAHCSLQEPLKGEHRAAWCHRALGVEGMDWDASVKQLAANGFTDLMVNMLWGGVAFYDSKVLPVAPDVKTKGGQIEKCLAACRKYGVKCHIWKVNWNMGWQAPPDFLRKMRENGRTQVTFSGKKNDTWLCPSHPDNQELEIQAMLEVARNYKVDGIHFDYIRYPDSECCFCDGCRKRFEAAVGAKITNWPADVRQKPELFQAWLDFRRGNITKVVESVSRQARAVRPGIQISAAVYPNLPRDRDEVGQDWKLWCEKAYLDFVCPMDYAPGNAQFRNLVRRQQEWAGRVPCYPGIGVSTWTSVPDKIGRLIAQIKSTRELKTGGFTLFEYNAEEARDTIPLCGRGMTRKE